MNNNLAQVTQESDHPVFSIITPTNLRPQLLKRTICSIRDQTFKNYEHIIIDDANDPETGSIVNSFGDNKIVFQKHLFPKGPAGGYNTGIKISRGKFILFLDDDDEYLPAFLEKMYRHFSGADQNVGFIWTGISKFKDTDDGEKFMYSKVWPSKFSRKEVGLSAATSISNSYGLCVRKRCIDIIGLYDEALLFEDTDFLFRLAKKFDFETIPEILVKIHQHGSSQMTDKKNYPERIEFCEKILNRHIDLLNEFPKLYYVHYGAMAGFCYSLKLKQKGRKLFFLIIRKNPFHLLSYTDLLFFELTGKNTIDYYFNSILRKIVRSLKLK